MFPIRLQRTRPRDPGLIYWNEYISAPAGPAGPAGPAELPNYVAFDSTTTSISPDYYTVVANFESASGSEEEGEAHFKNMYYGLDDIHVSANTIDKKYYISRDKKYWHNISISALYAGAMLTIKLEYINNIIVARDDILEVMTDVYDLVAGAAYPCYGKFLESNVDYSFYKFNYNAGNIILYNAGNYINFANNTCVQNTTTLLIGITSLSSVIVVDHVTQI